MLFELKSAKLVEVTDVTSGTSKSGNEWTRATAVLEKVEGDYTTTIPLLVFGDRIMEAQGLVGSDVDAKYSVQSRKFNGRWYTDLTLRSIAAAGGGQPQKQERPPRPEPAKKEEEPDGDLPF